MIILDKTSNDLAFLKDNYDLFIFNIYADWCGECEMLKHELEILSKKNYIIIRSKIENEQKYVLENKIMGTPQSYIYKSGKKVWEHNGFIPSNLIEEQLNLWKK